MTGSQEIENSQRALAESCLLFFWKRDFNSGAKSGRQPNAKIQHQRMEGKGGVIWIDVFIILAETIKFYLWIKQGQQRNANLDWKGFSWTMFRCYIVSTWRIVLVTLFIIGMPCIAPKKSPKSWIIHLTSFERWRCFILWPWRTVNWVRSELTELLTTHKFKGKWPAGK